MEKQKAFMSRLQPDKLEIHYLPGATEDGPISSRKYTLTHSDLTGDLFLTIGLEYDRSQISGIYTRLMRDEILASWKETGSGNELHIYCHVSGGFVLGPANWRESIFRKELPLVLEALQYGDRKLIRVRKLGQAPVMIHFRRGSKEKVEDWGPIGDYELDPPNRNT